MKKSLLHIVLISILAVGFTGCGLLLPVSEPVSLTPLIKEEIILSGSNGEVEKGALLLKNGSKIFDPEGDILESFVINNETLSPEQELVQDLINITHVFSCRIYGLRKYKKKLKEDDGLC